MKYKKNSPASAISDFHPEKRAIEIPEDGNSQRFYSDPIYFDVKVPREFDTVTVNLTWQNLSQPILELGARKFRNSWGFVLKPLQNKIIDSVVASSNLAEKENQEWFCQNKDGVIFCQRNKTYANLSEFFEKPKHKVVSYNYNIPENIEHDVMNVDTNISEYDYLIATYDAPDDLEGGWYRRSIKYNWSDFDLYINEISFLVSAAQLDKGHGQIVIGDIGIILERDPLDWKGFIEYVKNQTRRLKK